jgi:predicted Fe-Mo cluster-binding NifX family protein
MKIAIPTNDRNSIAKRTGRATEFGIFTIENGEIQSVEYLKNTHSHVDHDRSEGKHHAKSKEHEEHNHDELLILFKNIDVLLVRAVGKHMRQTLKKGNISYKLVKIDTISEIISNYLEGLK